MGVLSSLCCCSCSERLTALLEMPLQRCQATATCTGKAECKPVHWREDELWERSSRMLMSSSDTPVFCNKK